MMCNADSQDLLYRQMAQAFEVLEDEVKKGRIQFYGVSTTAFTRSPAFPNPIEIDGLLANARRSAFIAPLLISCRK
jgi:hypothetical protein